MGGGGAGIPLSRREREVAALVAEGLTDKEIARRLVISERTAESHVQQIRNKLGFDNRAQVASWFTRQSLASAAPAAAPSTGQAAPARGPVSTVHHLPGSLTRFIGRGRELSEIRRLLQRGRLLTITGPGGCGKTRLVTEAVDQVVHRYPNGVWFVDLSGLTDASTIPRALAAALAVPDRESTDLLQTIVSELRGSRCRLQCLVILDNCEHLIDGSAAVAGALLTACPQLTILCTSREPLHVPGEMVWKLEPLGRSEAVELFADRASLGDPELALDEASTETVLEICRQLDGIPLALELAAARVGLTPLDELLATLQSSLSRLRRRGVPDRQQTMRTAIAWSTDLLAEPERSLFRRLAVFRGGFTLDAVREVCAGPAEGEALSLVESLQDKSLLARLPRRRERFRLLEPVRQHALDLLTACGQLEAVADRHLAFYAAMAERGGSELTGPGQTTWLEKLTDEHDNLRAALEWSRGRPAEERVRLALALERFWRVTGHLGEGRAWLDEAVAAGASPDAPAPVLAERAQALNAAAGLAWLQGDLAHARSQLEASLAIWREIGDESRVQHCLGNLGVVASTQADWAAGAAYLEESLAVAQRLGDELAAGILLGNLGVMGAHLGEHEAALDRLTESERILRRLGDDARLANALANLGLLAVRRGRVAEAAAHYQTSLRMQAALRQPQSLAECLEGVAWIAAHGGRPEPALRLGAAAAAIRQSVGAPHRPWSRQVVDDWLPAARERVGSAADAEWSAGQALSVPEAVDLAAEECEVAIAESP